MANGETSPFCHNDLNSLQKRKDAITSVKGLTLKNQYIFYFDCFTTRNIMYRVTRKAILVRTSWQHLCIDYYQKVCTVRVNKTGA